jgi:hypothetical protein
MNIITQTKFALGFTNLLGLGETVDFKQLMVVTLWITGTLCLLNIVLAILYHAHNKREVLSYYAACLLELPVFVFALLFYLGVIIRSQVPFPLPPGLPVNRAEIVAALAIGVGLFPAALWHRINLSELPKRIAADRQTMKNSAGISIHDPEEWFN